MTTLRSSPDYTVLESILRHLTQRDVIVANPTEEEVAVNPQLRHLVRVFLHLDDFDDGELRTRLDGILAARLPAHVAWEVVPWPAGATAEHAAPPSASFVPHHKYPYLLQLDQGVPPIVSGDAAAGTARHEALKRALPCLAEAVRRVTYDRGNPGAMVALIQSALLAPDSSPLEYAGLVEVGVARDRARKYSDELLARLEGSLTARRRPGEVPLLVLVLGLGEVRTINLNEYAPVVGQA